MTLEVTKLADGTVRVDRLDSGGEGWSIEHHRGWGIKITPLGASRIPVIPELLDRPDVIAKQRKDAGIEEPAPTPTPMLLHCPECSKRHIDEGEWATRPHHTHACQHCGAVWRPAVVDTVGVQFLPGFKNKER